MANIFNSVLLNKPKSSKFDLSHDVKMSLQMGRLYPTCVMEAIPGDYFKINVENMLRFLPLVSPVMHKVRVTTDFFFVPNRILWNEWEDWIANANSEASAPYLSLDDVPIAVGTLADYMGVPQGTYSQDIRISPLQFAAYYKIWDEFYRDQNLQTPKYVPVTSGDNTANYISLITSVPAFRAWMHDYFTSALPFAQKGDSVQIPLTVEQDIPVDLVSSNDNTNPMIWVNAGSDVPHGAGTANQAAGPSPFDYSAHVGTGPAVLDPNGRLTVDVQTQATDINTLRRAFKLQEWLERAARGGTRYVESILSHFGVKSSDARLQRPEFIGRGVQNMVISEVLSTAQTVDEFDTTVPVGLMAGHGISVGGTRNFNYHCEEHGFIIGLLSVQPVTAYQDGLHKSLTRFDKFDYAWPTFANLGEQEVKMKELRALSNTPEATFGYVPRYAEYKYMNSRVAGEMRTTLDFWHLGRKFADDPVLNAEFVECDPSRRIFAVTAVDEDHIVAHVVNNVTVNRKLPRFGIPQI